MNKWLIPICATQVIIGMQQEINVPNMIKNSLHPNTQLRQTQDVNKHLYNYFKSDFPVLFKNQNYLIQFILQTLDSCTAEHPLPLPLIKPIIKVLGEHTEQSKKEGFYLTDTVITSVIKQAVKLVHEEYQTEQEKIKSGFYRKISPYQLYTKENDKKIRHALQLINLDHTLHNGMLSDLASCIKDSEPGNLLWLQSTNTSLSKQPAVALALIANKNRFYLKPSHVQSKKDRGLTEKWLASLQRDSTGAINTNNTPAIIISNMQRLIQESEISPTSLARFLKKLSADYIIITTVADVKTLPEEIKSLVNKLIWTDDEVRPSLYDIEHYANLETLATLIEKYFSGKFTDNDEMGAALQILTQTQSALALNNLETICQWYTNNKITTLISNEEWGPTKKFTKFNEITINIWKKLLDLSQDDCNAILNAAKISSPNNVSARLESVDATTEKIVDLDLLEEAKKIYVRQKEQLYDIPQKN